MTMPDNKSLDSLFILAHSVKRNLQNQIEALELNIAPMHVRVLKIIDKKPQCTAVDIASFLNRDKAQVTRLLNSLIKQELIMKEPNSEDKRSQLLRITKSGQEIMEKLAEVENSMITKMQEGISKQDLETFQRVAKQMANILN
jgi:DNA-binding MarR family transcriptional regulator